MNVDLQRPASAGALALALQKRRAKWLLIAGFPLTLMVIVSIVFQVYARTGATRDAARLMEHTRNVASALEGLANASNAYSIRSQMQNLRMLLADDSQQLARLSALEPLASIAHDPATDSHSGDLSAGLAEMRQNASQLLTQQQADLDRSINTQPSAFLILLLLASTTLCLFSAVVYYQIRISVDTRKAIDGARRQAALENTLVSRASFDVRSALMAIVGHCDLPMENESLAQHRFTSIRSQASQIIAAVDGILDTPDTTHPDALSATSDTVAAAHLSARVLLAEDDPHLQKVIKFYLQSTGAEVIIVGDGQLAYQEAMLALNHANPFDLILMDVQMPKFDGRDATIMLRDAGYTHPIVALTANATDRERRRCMAAGCNGFLAKPVDQQELLRTMRRYVKPQIAARSTAEEVSDPAAESEITALRESFQAEIPSRIAEIGNAVVAKDFPRVGDLAHQLKGTAGCFGLTALSESAAALQTAAERPEPNETIQQCFRTLSERTLPTISAEAA